MKSQAKAWVLAGLLLPAFILGCTATTTVQGPPPTRVEVIPAAPSARHVWIPGHYIRRGRNYVWVNGFYRVAPARYNAWAPGHWQQTRRGQVWVDGHWQ
ncbi:YXWGXW repeat-containing protein [Spirosoma arboris]|nr:YXWGXW repeat-containing protein [Spirosoma arboris]